MQQQASVFLESKATKEEIITAGEKVIVSFYNGGLKKGFDALRYRTFLSKVMTSINYVPVHAMLQTIFFTAYLFTFKYRNGLEMKLYLIHLSGVGGLKVDYSCQSKPKCYQHQWIC